MNEEEARATLPFAVRYGLFPRDTQHAVQKMSATIFFPERILEKK